MTMINPAIHMAQAFAPATCANVAVGFDILGFAFDQLGDTVTLTRRDDQQIIIEDIQATEKLPFNVDHNTASVVIKHLCQQLQLKAGFSIHIKKGIPLSSGLGGSAASAVAALVAFNAFLSSPLSLSELANAALVGETLASGQPHADNIVPCLWGGLTLIYNVHPIQVIALPIPSLYCVIVHPHLQVATKEARQILKDQLSLKSHIQQSAHLAAFISALYQHDVALLKQSLQDIVIEAQRAAFVPGFYDIKEAALKAGALGMSFSGSGPTLFAFAPSAELAENIRNAMQMQLKQHQITSDAWMAPISQKAAQLLQTIQH